MTSTKHIVFIVPGFAKDEDDFLCVPPMQQLVQELAKQEKVQISILAIHYPYLAKQYVWNGIAVVSLGGNNVKGLRKLKFYRKAIGFLNNLNQKHKIDAVHSFWLSDASVIGARWSKRNGKPHFITLMGQEAERAKKYVRFLAKNDELIALSNEQKGRIERQLGVPVNHVIPFGIKNEAPQEFNTKRSTDILGVGSLIEVKNYVQFIDTVAELQSETSLNVKLIGDGPLRDELERYAKEKSAEIQFLGIVDRKRVLLEMCKAQIFFHPSKSESLGYVFLEALMCGMTIVSKNVGIAGDVTSHKWCIVENEEFKSTIRKQLSRDESPKSEMPFSISDTTKHYLNLWQIE